MIKTLYLSYLLHFLTVLAVLGLVLKGKPAGLRVRVVWGTGVGCSEKPQGSPRQSLSKAEPKPGYPGQAGP